MLGYLPSVAARRSYSLRRKRIEYQRHVTKHYFEFDFGLTDRCNPGDSKSSQHQKRDLILEKIRVDVDRMSGPGLEVFSDERVKGCLERILYLEAVRSPSSHFSVGLSYLTLPLFLTFLNSYFNGNDMSSGELMSQVTDEILEEIEADTYWCFTKLLQAIHHRYSSKAPILENMIVLLEEVIHRVEPLLHQHLKSYGVEFVWFSFRWMNCLLVQEMNATCALRLWDTCICEEQDSTHPFIHTKKTKNKTNICGFDSFYVYICVSLLQKVRQQILQKQNFEDILGFLQNLPTNLWETDEIELLLSQAYVWKSTFHGSERQLLQQALLNSNKNSLQKIRHWPPRKQTSRPDWSIETLSHVMYDAEGKILLSV